MMSSFLSEKSGLKGLYLLTNKKSRAFVPSYVWIKLVARSVWTKSWLSFAPLLSLLISSASALSLEEKYLKKKKETTCVRCYVFFFFFFFLYFYIFASWRKESENGNARTSEIQMRNRERESQLSWIIFGSVVPRMPRSYFRVQIPREKRHWIFMWSYSVRNV